MLSNANLKTKNPNLCLTTDVLCILLDFNNALVYFINFSAYYLWEINYFSVLFILVFRLQSHLFK